MPILKPHLTCLSESSPEVATWELGPTKTRGFLGVPQEGPGFIADAEYRAAGGGGTGHVLLVVTFETPFSLNCCEHSQLGCKGWMVQ